ncbi:undecaprenyl-diphosphatase [Acidovorax sp. 69]|uniref:phosphatase PAP2 family protein n=1 Tax=Acidovorax sp. 69 TaxID=2035202 RepID=UPI000C23A935|nr:phosphatase PAP2 family protein [Acidovorax sp. 69]PJI98808.1 undecaprenyl-diphosphatase [Acidovorax sp. 69]
MPPSTTTTTAATTLTTQAAELGTLLAHHPLAVWAIGMLAAALLGLAGLAALRCVQRHRPVLPPVPPMRAHGTLLAAMGVSACTWVLAGAAMADLAASGRPGGPWGALDDALAAGLQVQTPTAVLQLFSALTHLGDTGVLTALTATVTLVLWQRQQRLLATGWLVAMAGNGALTRVLKNLFERVRPEHLHGIAQAEGFSFPSGHSSASMVAYAMLAYLATRQLTRPWHAPAVATAGVLIFTTGWSRAVLQVHYASDVLAGWLLGGTWMLCTVLIIESLRGWRTPAPGRARA